MTHAELLDYIRQHGPADAAESVAKFYLPGLRDGLNFTNWRTDQVGGAVLFYEVDEEGIGLAAPRILCVNAPERDRAKWESLGSGPPNEPTTLLMTPGMGPVRELANRR